jgi:hypothetical protein
MKQDVLVSRGIAPRILNLGTRLEGNGRLHAPATLPPSKECPLPIGQEDGWPSEPVWTRRRKERNPIAPWAMGWTIGVLRFDSQRGWEFFSLPPRQEWLWGPPSLISNGYQRLFPWGQNGRGVNLTTHLHLVLRSKNEWSCASTPQYAFMAWCSVKSQGQFYLLPPSENRTSVVHPVAYSTD